MIAGFVVSEVPKLFGSHGAWLPSFTSKYPLPLWVIILSSAVVVGSVMFSVRLYFQQGAEFKPEISKVDQSVSVADPAQNRNYPLKCYIQFCNNSPRCVEVRIGDFKPNKVSLKRFVPNVLQVKVHDWTPMPDGVDRIAVMTGQIFRVWIGIDEKLFTDTRVRDLSGQLGTLSLMVEGKRLPFEL